MVLENVKQHQEEQLKQHQEGHEANIFSLVVVIGFNRAGRGLANTSFWWIASGIA